MDERVAIVEGGAIEAGKGVPVVADFGSAGTVPHELVSGLPIVTWISSGFTYCESKILQKHIFALQVRGPIFHLSDETLR